ncbi:MAG: hypothetical protein HLX50_00485 [Alteromonadaceae bacterium]|nr:hypothetical protein [Alteromonadaceae bacterium]
MAIPPVSYTAVQANPLGGGLYDAASVVDAADGRHLSGIMLEPVNDGISGLWEYAGDANPDKVGERLDWPSFPGTVVWAADSVKTVGASIEGARERAEHILRLREPVEVEQFVAGQLLQAEASAVASVKEQLAHLELELGKRGYPGVVHASRELLPFLKDFIVRQGQAMFTPGGHRWAFGGGYEALGTTLVGTGAVTVVRSPVTQAEAIDTRLNDFHAIAERVVAIGWEGDALAVSLTEAA